MYSPDTSPIAALWVAAVDPQSLLGSTNFILQVVAFEQFASVTQIKTTFSANTIKYDQYLSGV